MTQQLLVDTVSASSAATSRRRRWGWCSAVLVAATLGTAACSSSTTSSAPPPNPATAQADIQVPYGTLFNLSNNNVNAMLATIQDGESLRAATTNALTSPLSKSATGATVSAVSLLSASECAAAKVPHPCAKVTYSILGPGGQVLLPNSTGYAVYVDGHWLVAKATICGLFELLYQTENKTGTPQGCAS
jgi:hypothetical protein